jgi:hypothetical protein
VQVGQPIVVEFFRNLYFPQTTQTFYLLKRSQ